MVQEIEHTFIRELRKSMANLRTVQHVAYFVERHGTEKQFHSAFVHESEARAGRPSLTACRLQQGHRVEDRRNHG